MLFPYLLKGGEYVLRPSLFKTRRVGIVTGRTVFDDPFACPVGDAFAVGTAHPIFFLSEMALAAHLVAVIHIHFHAPFGYQKITLILFVTGKTGQGFILPAMNQDDITMGHFSGLCNRDFFIVVTLTALKALDLVLAGLCPENALPGILSSPERFYPEAAGPNRRSFHHQTGRLHFCRSV